MANELKTFVENLSGEEKEELKAFLKILERKLRQEDFYHRYNICPSCGAKMTLEDGIYQCSKCEYTHVEGY